MCRPGNSPQAESCVAIPKVRHSIETGKQLEHFCELVRGPSSPLAMMRGQIFSNFLLFSSCVAGQRPPAGDSVTPHFLALLSAASVPCRSPSSEGP